MVDSSYKTVKFDGGGYLVTWKLKPCQHSNSSLFIK